MHKEIRADILSFLEKSLPKEDTNKSAAYIHSLSNQIVINGTVMGAQEVTFVGNTQVGFNGANATYTHSVNEKNPLSRREYGQRIRSRG